MNYSMTPGSTTFPRKLLAVGACILAAMLLASSGAVAEMKKEIAIGIGPDLGTATHAVIALRKGYFADEGLDVELKKFPAGLVQVEALAAGNLDFAVPAQAPVFSLRSAGIPIVILANTATWSEALSLVVREDADIETPKDLEGKKIGLLKGSTAELMYRAILEEYGVDPKKVQAVSMKPPEQLSSLISKSLDGIVVWEPWALKAVKEANAVKRHTGGTSMFVDSKGKKVTVDWTRTVLTTLEPTIEQHPETVDAVLRAFVKSQDFVANPANFDQVVSIFSEFQGQDPELNRALLPMFDMNLRLDEAFLDGMNQPLDFLESIGRIKNRIDVLDYTYTSPLNEARPEWVTIKSKFTL